MLTQDHSWHIFWPSAHSDLDSPREKEKKTLLERQSMHVRRKSTCSVAPGRRPETFGESARGSVIEAQTDQNFLQTDSLGHKLAKILLYRTSSDSDSNSSNYYSPGLMQTQIHGSMWVWVRGLIMTEVANICARVTSTPNPIAYYFFFSMSGYGRRITGRIYLHEGYLKSKGRLQIFIYLYIKMKI